MSDSLEFEFSPDVLIAALAATAPSASTDETRFHLMGVAAVVEDGRLGFVATDGHRLTRVMTHAAVSPTDTRVLAIIPLADIKSMLAMSKDCRKSVTPLAMAIAGGSDQTVTLTHAGRTIVSKAIKSTFPAYGAVVPAVTRTAASCVGVNPAYFAEAMKACGLYCGKSTGVKVALGGALDPMRFDASSAHLGDVTVVVMPMRV